MQDFEEEVGIPTCRFAAGFDASLRFVRAHEAEREASDDGHVLGAVAGSIAREVVLERHVELPVHAFDAPMAASTSGDALDVERRGANVDACIERASIGVFRPVDDVNERLDVFEARLTWIGFFTLDPIDYLRGRVDTGFDAAVALLDWSLLSALC